MSASERALERLRAEDGEALTALARMVVEQATETPLAEIASPRWVASQLKAVLEAGVHGDHVRDWVDRRIAAERERWAALKNKPKSTGSTGPGAPTEIDVRLLGTVVANPSVYSSALIVEDGKDA